MRCLYPCNGPKQIGLYFQINLSNVILTVSSILCTDVLPLAMLTSVYRVHSSNIDKHKLTIKYNIINV